MDKDDKQVSIYDPEHKINAIGGAVHNLGDDEELIGVYGKKDKNDDFSAFGFITKVPDE